MAKGFVYRGQDRTADSISRKKSEGSREYDSVYRGGLPTFKPREGDNCIRILPGTWGEPDWDLIVYSHYDVGPDGGRYLCLDKMKGERCPVCEARAEMTDAEEADKLQPIKGAVCWVIDRDNEKAGPQIWSIPLTKVRNEIHARSLDKKSGAPILIDHPEEGFDVVFARKGTDTRTQYTGVEVLREASPLHENEKIQQRWLDYVAANPLPDCLNYYSASHIEKVLFGKATQKPSKAVEDDGDEEIVPQRRRPPKSRDEEDEDAAPVRNTSRRTAAPVVDEDEEEAPAPSRRRSLAVDADEEEEAPSGKNDSGSRRRALLREEEEGSGVADDEDEVPFTASRRRPVRGAASTGDEEAPEDDPVSTARSRLKDLRRSR